MNSSFTLNALLCKRSRIGQGMCSPTSALGPGLTSGCFTIRALCLSFCSDVCAAASSWSWGKCLESYRDPCKELGRSGIVGIVSAYFRGCLLKQILDKHGLLFQHSQNQYHNCFYTVKQRIN